MPDITNVVEIDAAPDKVWAVLGDLTATPDWLPGTVSARVEGPIRTCVMADGSEVREQIDGYSADDHTFGWRHLQVPLPIENSHGTFTVSSDDDKSTVTLTTHFEPVGDADVTEMIHGAFQQSLESLRRFVEEGIRWSAASG